MRNELKAVHLLVLCCAAGCSTQETVGSKYAKSQTVQALVGGTVTVTDADDPALAGTSVSIPPGALPADTLIRVAEASTLTLPTSATAAGPVVALEPTDVSFAHPVTIRIRCRRPGDGGASGLFVQGLDADGTSIRVSSADLAVDESTGTVAFTATRFRRFGCGWGPPSSGSCPAGETFCGCCGNGTCVPDGQPCPAIACTACQSDGGIPATDGGGGSGGGSSCCPAGEQFCGCGSLGTCIPAGTACPLMCPVGAGGGATSAGRTCCGPGTYLCGCGGAGICLPVDQACPLSCPACDPTLLPTPCGCLPPGASCGCDATSPSTVPCQCTPTGTASPLPATGVCVVDAGSPCADPTERLTACGCLPAGATCAPADAGTPCASPTEHQCCDGLCVSAGGVCPTVCLADGGVHPVDGGVCPTGTARCPDGSCMPSTGICR